MLRPAAGTGGAVRQPRPRAGALGRRVPAGGGGPGPRGARPAARDRPPGRALAGLRAAADRPRPAPGRGCRRAAPGSGAPAAGPPGQPAGASGACRQPGAGGPAARLAPGRAGRLVAQGAGPARGCRRRRRGAAARATAGGGAPVAAKQPGDAGGPRSSVAYPDLCQPDPAHGPDAPAPGRPPAAAGWPAAGLAVAL